MDQLSGMPKAILHDILARLPDKDAAKTILLSKVWRDTWYSFPYLSVQGQYFYTEDEDEDGDNLIDYVTKRLARLRDQGLAIKEFKLNLGGLLDPGFVSHHLDQLIRMASESDVEVLQLQLRAKSGMWCDAGMWYYLPVCVIEAKSLTKLELGSGVRIGQEILKHSVKLSSVKMLSLSDVLFAHEGDMEHFISLCPLTEHLTIDCCYVHNHPHTQLHSFIFHVKSLFLHGLQKLKEVDVRGIQEVHIDSPYLENLCYKPLDFLAPFKLNFDSCTSLRSLTLFSLKSTDIVDNFFVELFSKHPFLESLKLYKCYVSKRIHISSAQLKVLVLKFCSLNEVMVDAPNLLSFYCDGHYKHYKPVIFFLRSSNLLKVKVDTILDFQHFYSLREFIWNIPPKILASLSLFIHRSYHKYDYACLPELQVSSIPPSIKHLEMRLGSYPNNEAFYGSLMNYLLLSCFPKTISFMYGSRYTFIEFFYDMLMGIKKGECHCSSSDTKCWWHALKIVNISCSFITNQNIDFKAMLDVWPSKSLDAKITFNLEL